jgi:ubiquinone/menaquinone biosynthesis C-methylase UbiE
LAEGEGFEPPVTYSATTVFKTVAFVHSAIPPEPSRVYHAKRDVSNLASERVSESAGQRVRSKENGMHAGEETGPTGHGGLWQRLVGFSFRLLYHELAWSYDLVAWLVSLGQWRAWGRTALPHLVGERVLELGHGPGHLLVALVASGLRPVGLDSSPQMGRLARRRLRRAGLGQSLLRGHAQRLPFPTHSFDSVLATFPTVYIASAMTLAEVTRVLRPGGRMVVVLGTRLSGRDPLSRFIEWLYRITGQRETADAAAWEAPFVAAGLSVRRVEVAMKRSQVYILIAEPAALKTGRRLRG